MAETKKKNQAGNALPIGTILKGGQYAYRIEEVLGQGSYGITYRVSAQVLFGNITKEVSFAVKENFTKKYCSRKADGVTMKYPSEFADDVERDLQDFLSEGKKLREICKESKNIVKVNETWRENGTAYYAMEYIDGGNLCDYVKDRGRLSEKEAIDILNPVIDAVGIIHQHRLLHLDIKPDNIMLEKRKGAGFEPILIDFGITLHFNQNGVITNTSKDHSIGCSDGYAPIEQYGGINHFAPTADVYALGATLYYMIVGKDPVKASDINAKKIDASIPSNVSTQIRRALLHSMKSMKDERTPTIEIFSKELKGKSIIDSNANGSQLDSMSRNGSGQGTKEIKNLSITIEAKGPGNVTFKEKTIRHNKIIYQISEHSSVDIAISPDTTSEIKSILVNETDVTSRIINRKLTLNDVKNDQKVCINFDTVISSNSNREPVIYKWLKYIIIGIIFFGILYILYYNSSSDNTENVNSSDTETIIDNLCNNMVFIEGGVFTMGATPEQGVDIDDCQKPVHQVTLSSFTIGKHEVTQEEWQAVMNDNPSYNIGMKCPVEKVSWEDCQEFIHKLNIMTGKKFRLPTEAEWEYAARGGNKSKVYKYAGNNNIDVVGWYNNNSDHKTHEVSQKTPNELGLYDMNGNVMEWCQDWYDDYSNKDMDNPIGPLSGSDRVLRGGSFLHDSRDCSIAARFCDNPSQRYYLYGFRLAQ